MLVGKSRNKRRSSEGRKGAKEMLTYEEERNDGKYVQAAPQAGWRWTECAVYSMCTIWVLQQCAGQVYCATVGYRPEGRVKAYPDEHKAYAHRNADE